MAASIGRLRMGRGVMTRAAVYGSVAVLAVVTLWQPYLQRFEPLADASERFVALAEEAERARAAERRREGELAGEAAAREGELAVYEYGLPIGADRDYRDLLLSRYGVTVHNVGCMPIAGEWDWQAGFSAAIRRATEQEYGHDIFAECRQDARALQEARPKSDCVKGPSAVRAPGE